MTEKVNISTLLKKRYFWDVDISRGKALPKRLVIERIFGLGTIEEVALVLRFYGYKEVEKNLLTLNYLDPKTLNFVSKYFNRPKREFRCYTKKQSTLQYWD